MIIMTNFIKLQVLITLLIGLIWCTPLNPAPSLKLSRSRCIEPQITTLDSKWFLFKNLININVYSCQMKTVKSQYACSNQSYQKEFKTEYYDVTKKCIDAIIRKNQKNNSITKKYPCEDNIIIEEVTYNIITTDAALVSLESDELFLPSGTVCQYSLGFCYDIKLDFKGYTWEKKQYAKEDVVSCDNFVKLNSFNSVIVKLVTDREYIVFEEEKIAYAVELVKEIDVCGTTGWTDNKGSFVTSNYNFGRYEQHREFETSSLYTKSSNKQDLYESLSCVADNRISEIYFYTTIFLLVYVLLHFIFSVYNHLINYITLSRVKSKISCWCFQSSINKNLISNSAATENKIESDIELRQKSRQESFHYYELQRNLNR